jgi:hypothetical protein
MAREIQVHLRTLADYGAPWDNEHVERLVQELANIGVNLDSSEPRARNLAPLEPVADDNTRQDLLALMERVLDTLTASPWGTDANRVSRGLPNSEAVEPPWRGGNAVC